LPALLACAGGWQHAAAAAELKLLQCTVDVKINAPSGVVKCYINVAVPQ
jgi:hypothetical protein